MLRNKNQKNHKIKKKRWLKGVIHIFIWGTIATIAVIAWYSYDLPDIRTLEEAERKPSITMLTKDGELLTTYGDLYGSTVTLDKIPDFVPKAVLAIEDHRFYTHPGIDFIAFARAVYHNVMRGRVVQGGSSITQQLAKNFLLAKKKFNYMDRSLRRKVQELLVSLWLEYHFTKDQILSIYLNRIDFGSGVYGFDAAAQRYFFKPLNEVTVFEAAVLAGMLKAPTRYNPLRHPKAAVERANVVIKKMIDHNFISKPTATVAINVGKEQLLNRRVDIGSYRYFTDWIMDTLPSYLGYLDRDLLVVTSLNLRAQEAANRTIKHIIAEKGNEKGFKQMALVSMTTDGEVIAMVGGHEYSHSQFNRATQALRQPGSAFKSFVYVAAFEKGFTPYDIMNDEPKTYGGKWTPKNIYNQYRGDLSLEDALAYSSNTITVKLLEAVGVGSLIKLVRRLGIQTKLAKNLTLALGSGEVTLFDLTAAYGVIANQGFELYPHGIVEIRDKHTDELLYQSSKPQQRKLLDDTVVRDIDQALTSAVHYGTSRRSQLKHNIPSAGKSGTSQNYRDGWFVGYVKRRKGPITGVWVGNDDNSPTKGVVGGSIPAESWKLFHDMWLTPTIEDKASEQQPTPHHSNSTPPVDEPPAAEGDLDGIDQVLSLISAGNDASEDEITPESLEQQETFDAN